MTQDMITLGFDKIIQQLQDQAVSQAARQKLAETEPILHEGLCRARMEETTAARCVMENAGTPPFTDTEGTENGLIEELFIDDNVNVAGEQITDEEKANYHSKIDTDEAEDE